MTPTVNYNVNYGTIVCYNAREAFGYIRPDIARADRWEVYFRNEDSRMPFERELDMVVLREENFGGGSEGYLTLKNLPPKVGDRVAYYSKDDLNGPVAHRWTWAKEWDKAMNLLKSRSFPEQPLARAYRIAEDHITKIIVWEGFYDRLANAVRTNEPFLQIPGLHFEWRLVHGWKPIKVSREDFLTPRIQLPEEHKQNSMRMYLALLIEQGISILARDCGDNAGTDLLRYAAIGRVRKSKGSHNLWGLENRLPTGNPAAVGVAYGVGLITNLDPMFLYSVSAKSRYLGLQNHLFIAKEVVMQLRGQMPFCAICSIPGSLEEAWMYDYIALIKKQKPELQLT